MAKQILVITSYPEKKSTHSKKTVGGASYTKILLESVKKFDKNLNINILAEYFTKPQKYLENKIKVNRCWQRNNFSSILNLAQKIILAPEKMILLSFEGYMFGSPVLALLILLALLIAKLNNKKIIILLHQVLADFKALESNLLKINLLNILKNILYKLIKLTASKIIVFEAKLKQILKNNNKITTLPHLIIPSKNINQKLAKQKLKLNLNKKHILYFGYLAPYKGIDELIKVWPQDRNLNLIIAGDINPNHLNNNNIKNFVKNIKNNIKNNKNIIQTGFVPENKINLYFSAADLVILPYKTFMSSSGPLSIAIAHFKPILLSKPLAAYAKTTDFKQALKISNLKINNIIFDFNQKDLLKKINNIINNKSKFKILAEYLQKSRSTQNIAQQLSKIIK